MAGTYPESAQIGTVRQLFRVIGRELAHATSNTESSIALARSSYDASATIKNPLRGLYAAVEFISRAHGGYDEATDLLESHFKETVVAKRPQEKIAELMALARAAFEKMIDTQLSKPQGSFERSNGDNTMLTLFGATGELKSVHITLMHGKLAGYLAHNLREASESSPEQKRALLERGTAQDNSVFETKLRIVHPTKSERSSEHTFKTTKADLKASYLRALVQYASIAYADRMRTERPSPLE